MTFDTLDIEYKGVAAWVWLNRPEVHNAFDETLIAQLTEALQTLDRTPGLRALVIAGRGKSFSAGADLKWMQRQGQASMADNLADARRLAELFRVLAACKKPTIARVHGAAMGGGMGLAATCDICLASTDATFATSEVRLGLVPGVISPYVIRAIGARQAYRYFQTAERMSATKAQELGLAHEVSVPDELDHTVQQMIDALARGGPEAQVASVDLIRLAARGPIDASLIEDCAQSIATIRASAQAKEGLAAFLGKRVPQWEDV
jgi:methylglutaconyl-CoA hydratase